jgi:hypothetical protein
MRKQKLNVAVIKAPAEPEFRQRTNGTHASGCLS